MKAISLRKMVIAILIIGIGAGYARADKQQLQAKLGKDVGFEFKDVTIAQALGEIGQEAGAKIVLSDEAVWKLPQGEATRLSASLKGPLADSLTEMLNAFFMRYAVGYDRITIYPRPELEHILGRPTIEQLELLKKIYSLRIKVTGEALSTETFTKLLEGSFGEISFLPSIALRDIQEILHSQRGLSVTLDVLLKQAGDYTKTPCWYISGMDSPNQIPRINLVRDNEFKEAKLDQVVDISFKDERADVILQRLAGWAGMELIVSKSDASWLEEVINVDMQNIKLRQALRNIVSSVDGELAIDVGDNNIQIVGPMRPREKATPVKPKSSGGAGEGYVGKISIPMDGGKYFIEFMLRESDLTEELKKLREEKIREILRKVSKADDKTPEIASHPQAYSILN